MIPEWTERWIILAFSRESSVITYIPSLGRLTVSIIYKGISHGPSLWLTSLASASNTAYPVLNLNVTYGGLFAKSCLTHVIPWTGALQAPLSMGICRQENWSGLHFLLQRISLTQGLNCGLLRCRQTLYQRCYIGTSERVTGRKARGLQMEEIACKCQTFLSLLSGRRKQTNNIFFLLYTNLKRGFS